MQIDPSEYGASDLVGGPVPEGDHIVMISDIEATTSKSSGNPMVRLDVELIDPDSEHCGRSIRFQYYVLTQGKTNSRGKKGLGMIRHYIALCQAIDPKMRSHNPTDQADLDSLLFGLPFVAKVEHEEDEYEGTVNTRCRIRGHKALTKAMESRLAEAYGDAMVPAQDTEDAPF